MQIAFCPRSAVVGVVVGAVVVASAWYGITLTGRAEITQALLAGARCDPAGFVSITFQDNSQFTCAPRETFPPTSREEAARRKKGNP